MPLPWLIGGAIFASVAAVIAKSSSSESTTESTSTSDDFEKRHAEQERIAKCNAISAEVEGRIEDAYEDIKLTLANLVNVNGDKKNKIELSKIYEHDINIQFSFVKNSTFEVSSELKELFPLCSDTTLANIHDYMQIYGIRVKPSDLLKQEISEIQALTIELQRLEQEIKSLKN